MRHRLWVAAAMATVITFFAFMLFTVIRVIDWIFGSDSRIWLAFLSGWLIIVLILAAVDIATNEEEPTPPEEER